MCSLYCRYKNFGKKKINFGKKKINLCVLNGPMFLQFGTNLIQNVVLY